MQVTYIPSSNTATNGQALSSITDQDVRLFRLVVGNPVSAGNVTVYSINNPVNGATTNIAAKLTFPTFSTTNVNAGPQVLDFGEGVVLNGGGNVIIDQSMQVTAMWELDDDAKA